MDSLGRQLPLIWVLKGEQDDWSVSGRWHPNLWVQMCKSRRHGRGCCLGTLRSWAWPECGGVGRAEARREARPAKKLIISYPVGHRESWRDFKQGSNSWRKMTFHPRREKKPTEMESLVSNCKIPNKSLEGVLRRGRPSSLYEASRGDLDFRCVEKGGKD